MKGAAYTYLMPYAGTILCRRHHVTSYPPQGNAKFQTAVYHVQDYPSPGPCCCTLDMFMAWRVVLQPLIDLCHCGHRIQQ